MRMLDVIKNITKHIRKKRNTESIAKTGLQKMSALEWIGTVTGATPGMLDDIIVPPWFENIFRKEMERKTNNWRKMHGVPMRRRGKRRHERRKRTDSH